MANGGHKIHKTFMKRGRGFVEMLVLEPKCLLFIFPILYFWHRQHNQIILLHIHLHSKLLQEFAASPKLVLEEDQYC